MKKVLSLLLAFAMIFAVVPMSALTASAASDDYYSNGYYYRVSSGKATITDVDGYIGGNITIPSKLDGYPVTSIGDSAFWGCSSLISVTIPILVTLPGIVTDVKLLQW